MKKDQPEEHIPDFDPEARLMRAAQKFAIGFSEIRLWGDEIKRLEYTISAWRELAMAAIQYARYFNTPHP